MRDTFLDGESYFRLIRNQGLVLIDMDRMERSIVKDEAGHAVYEILQDFVKQEFLDGKSIALYQRAMAGWFLRAGMAVSRDELNSTLQISLNPSSDPMIRRACRLLAMVHELHKAGYQRIRIAAGMAPLGRHWRCHITTADNVRLNGWEPIDWDDGVESYSTGDENRYFGWSDATAKGARHLAQLFLERFPALVQRGAGRDRPYAGWYVEMLGAAENGRLPVFFADYDLEENPQEMPPPPLGGMPGKSSQSENWIANEDLCEEMLPSRLATWQEIEPFCISFDGFAAGRRSVDECVGIAHRVQQEPLEKASMDDLRVTLFIHQRKIRWNSDMPVDPKLIGFFREVIDEIRRRLIR